jgi:hypothetical protein
MKNSPKPASDRKSAEMALGGVGSRSEPGTTVESLSEVRDRLREFDEGGGKSASAKDSAPVAYEPRGAEPDTPSGGAVEPAASILTARPRRRNRIAVAALAVGGLAVVGTAGLVSAGRLGLPPLAVSTGVNEEAAVGNQPKIVARAPLPPMRGVAAPPSDVMPLSRVGTGHEVPSHTDSGTTQPHPPSALAERASKFINSYWEQSGASSDQALRYLSSIYAAVVDYYGQQRTRHSVLQDKHAFLRRWPIRQTWPALEAESPTISCDRAGAECEITGLRDFAAESPKRRARSIGVVRYSYKVRFVDGAAQIVAESSKVIGTGAIAISSPAALLSRR